MSVKRVLVVDDEPNVAQVIAEALGMLPNACEFLVAENAAQAVGYAQAGPIDVLITDYNMPEVDGLTLIEQLRRYSPQLATILITGQDPGRVSRQAAQQGVDHFMSKPFKLRDIRQLVRDLLDRMEAAPAPPPTPDQLQQILSDLLRHLVSDTGARGVVLVSTDGNLIESAGNLVGLDLPVLSTLMAANFAAVTEIARLMGNPRSFDAINHESKVDNIYSCAIGAKHLLVVVYGLNVKPGVVWHFVKKVVHDLTQVVEALPTTPLPNLAAPALDAALDDALFDNSLETFSAPLTHMPPAAAITPAELELLTAAIQRGMAKQR